jgi:hypothetical protein
MLTYTTNVSRNKKEEERKLEYVWKQTKIGRFEVLTAVAVKSSIFWDITPCGLLKVNRLSLNYTALYRK